MAKLSEVINREQLLNLALKVIAMCDEDKEDRDAVAIVVWYIIGSFKKRGIEPTQETVEAQYKELVDAFVMTQLVTKGHVEAVIGDDGNIVYKATEKGLESVKRAENAKSVNN